MATATLSPGTLAEKRYFDFAASGLERTPFHLSPEQVKFYDDFGYLILRQRVTGELLKRIQDAGTRWIDMALASQGKATIGSATVQDIVAEDFNFAHRSSGKRVPFRVNYIHNKREPASLELLGSPEVLGVAESLNGPDFVPTYESMVFKMAGDGERIAWHQDAVFARNFRTWNFDLYLDHSGAKGGALRVIPGSHKATHDVCKFARDNEWSHPDQIIVEMEPGDVLIHDDMVLHGSPATEGEHAKLRRTVYFEFRNVQQIQAEGPWPMQFAHDRLRLIPVAMRRFAERFPDRTPFTWNVSPEHRPTLTGDESTELKIAHKVHTSGSYCSATST
jgi:ectoine hydroxylase-related dioxygenase (phytanoyl-CoA dioxygenase family)